MVPRSNRVQLEREGSEFRELVTYEGVSSNGVRYLVTLEMKSTAIHQVPYFIPHCFYYCPWDWVFRSECRIESNEFKQIFVSLDQCVKNAVYDLGKKKDKEVRQKLIDGISGDVH